MTAGKSSRKERPPVVVVMGHVDHGKSTLLDYIRKSNVVAGEAGGITQHVAAYEVVHKDKRITFIDTPGHAAFSAIRARGANVADIAILVVAADDGVKAQTLEALSQIREAGIPFLVAINKMDKPNADLNRTQASLMEKDVFLEKLGGDVPWAAISAKTGQGVEELLDVILLVAEIQGYEADASEAAEGYVVEAHRDQKRGIAATLIITSGTLEIGMAVLAGTAIAPVRIMEDHRGKSLKNATFSTPVSLVGFDELPAVGATFKTYKNKKEAETARAQIAPAKTSPAAGQEMVEGRYYMPIIVRADVTGSLEAILQEIARLGDEHSRVNIVQSGIGNVSEGDIKTALAGTAQAVIIGFNVGTDPVAETLSRERVVSVEHFNIIYKLTERVGELLETSRPKRRVEEILGRARILKVFSSRKQEHVIGGSVTDGHISKDAEFRVLRRKVPVGEGAFINIQTNRQNVSRAESPIEFGAQVEAPFEPAEGDMIECFVRKTV
jgi:translation initiation factor IF-2